jgi:fructokinase
LICPSLKGNKSPNVKTKFNVLGIGEVLWDLLLTGPKMGGAPANFAYHAHALGAKSHAITRIGKDALGREIQARFRELSLPAATIQEDDAAPTGTAKVSLRGDGLANFTIQENVAWDYLAATPEAQAVAREADAICFGSLAQRSATSRETIQRLVASTPSQGLRIFDINLRQKYYSREVIEQSLQLANVLKLNDDELPVLSKMFGIIGSTEDQIKQLAKRLAVAQATEPPSSRGHLAIALTRGARGSLLYRPSDGRWSDCASRPIDVVDTVGAGDSFTAALVLGLLHNLDLDDNNSFANEVARYVCSQAGATPTMPAEFAERFRTLSSR